MKKNYKIEKIKSLWQYRLVPLLIKFSLFINSPKLAALILAGSLRKVNNQGNYKVLCLARSIFMDDVKAMAIYSGQINYIAVNISTFENIFAYFTKGQESRDLTEENYHIHNKSSKAKQRYYKFLNGLIPSLQKLTDFQAVLSGNFNYRSQQEFARVCLEKNIPFIVLYKEGMPSHGIMDNYIKLYKDNKIICTKILFHGKEIMNALLGMNLPGLTKEKSECYEGVPRFDFYFYRDKGKDTNQKQIVFFSFIPRVSYRFYNLDEKRLDEIEKRSIEFYKFAINFALKHQDYKVIIKTKRAKYFTDYVEDIIKNNFNEEIKNLTITNIMEPMELINNSLAVIGCSSTVLIEAVIAGKVVITPYFGDILSDKESWDFFGNHPQLVNYARRYGEFEDYILNSEKYLNYEPEIKKDFLLVYNSASAGGASIRAEKAIIRTILNN